MSKIFIFHAKNRTICLPTLCTVGSSPDKRRVETASKEKAELSQVENSFRVKRVNFSQTAFGAKKSIQRTSDCAARITADFGTETFVFEVSLDKFEEHIVNSLEFKSDDYFSIGFDKTFFIAPEGDASLIEFAPKKVVNSAKEVPPFTLIKKSDHFYLYLGSVNKTTLSKAETKQVQKKDRYGYNTTENVIATYDLKNSSESVCLYLSRTHTEASAKMLEFSQKNYKNQYHALQSAKSILIGSEIISEHPDLADSLMERFAEPVLQTFWRKTESFFSFERAGDATLQKFEAETGAKIIKK